MQAIGWGPVYAVAVEIALPSNSRIDPGKRRLGQKRCQDRTAEGVVRTSGFVCYWVGDHNTLSQPNQPLTHLAPLRHRTLWTGVRIRFGHDPKMALFRISRGAATARFRGPRSAQPPSRQATHFGFVPW